MTNRQIVALNNLYAATIEVMEAFQSESVDFEMRKKKIACLLENFLMGSTTIVDVAPSQEPIHTVCSNENMNSVTQQNQEPNLSQEVETSNQPTQPADDSYVSVVKAEGNTGIRYSVSPKKSDDNWVFKRLSDKSQDDKQDGYFYKINLEGDTGTFEFMHRDSDINKINFDEIMPPKVVAVASGSVKRENAVEIVTIESGRLVKDGKSWRVTKPVTVQFK